MNAHTQIIPRSTIESVCKFRDKSLAKMRESAEALEAAHAIGAEANNFAALAYVGSKPSAYHTEDRSDFNALFGYEKFDIDKSMEAYRRHIDSRIWNHLIDTMGIRKMMDATALKELNASISKDVPEATLDNVRATLQTLAGDSGMIFRRGLVNCFARLDRRFKSHDGFKIGSRIILNHAFCESSGTTNWRGTWDAIADVERVLAVLDGADPEGSYALRKQVDNDRKGHWGPQQSETEAPYFRIVGYKNGNAHLWFTRDDLVRQANKILAEHYGEVLPDHYDEGDKDADLFNGSTAVSKDLQFYPTPPEIVHPILAKLHLCEGARLLEPSAGQGAFAIPAAVAGAQVDSIEVDPDHIAVMKSRAARQPAKGTLRTKTGNFLSMKPSPVYDFVVMNPPFYGTHYMDHVMHAFKFLSPGGVLIAVLPASAEVNESRKHTAFRKWAMEHNDLGWTGPFRDLPEESFKASGTMIQTVTMQIRAPR